MEPVEANPTAEASDTDICEVLMAGTHFKSIQEFDSTTLESLLGFICSVYEITIGQRLVTMNLLSQHNLAFTEQPHATEASLSPQSQQCLNAETQSLVVRPNEGLFQVQTSRYLSDFEEICRLGKGSFGKVYKVKNKLDGQNYAVKKILIKNNCMKVLREVEVLSSLQHVNVVGYNTAWMEHVQPAAYPQSHLPALESTAQQQSSDESPDCSSTSSLIIFQSTDHAQRDAVSCQPAENTSISTGDAVSWDGPTVHPSGVSAVSSVGATMSPGGAPAVRSDALTNSASRISDLSTCESTTSPDRRPDRRPALSFDGSSGENSMMNSNLCTDTEQRGDGSTVHSSGVSAVISVHLYMMLYIQMQLCERSLKDWISERNYTPKEEHASRCPYGCVDTEHTLSLLRKILEGVEYIHSRGIMHRDLKPGNIFLHGHDCHVRIGDFGLACRDIIADDHDASASHNSGSSHTTGVGTRVYAAPEKLEGSHYDSKSDMYSIGVIALELFQPFGTEMERARTLEDLRKGKIPDSFHHRWPVLAEQVMKLTSKDPSVRPTATQLLQSELFSSKDMDIQGLQKRVEKQEEEIIQLKRRISQLQCSQNSGHYYDSNKT